MGMSLNLKTMIKDLNSGLHLGVRGALSGCEDEYREINGSHRIKQLGTYVKLSTAAAPNNYLLYAKAGCDTADGIYLDFDDMWSTMATITRTHRVVISGNFSGCLYSVYSTGSGEYKCFHTARPGTDSDILVGPLRQYAADRRWQLVHEVPTRNDANSGVGMNGCNGTVVVTRVSYTIAPKPIVRTIRLRVDSMGRTVHRQRWDTVTP